ncbi:RNA polymerase subunit sigma-70 [Gemella sp. zg-1178]|uniref:RNA polymerase subunit sigma-70 n=1 Tax=Gemella sp. zg-1178 TaxID=2840372 RepID=UPI001C054496|nr:RNA polymerase subunit sigma-70 [Gemella sp. zg-1178]MBU0279365.1 RNA polymerase subunit sigma-70 [Gemella sp. zg-1178]
MNQLTQTKIIQLRNQGIGYTKIANQLNISVNTIKYFCRRNNVTIGNVQDNHLTKTECEHCSTCIQQVKGRKVKRFCCNKCRNSWWNNHLDLVKRKAIYKCKCLNCKKTVEVYGNKNRKYCSHECYIEYRFRGVHHD